MAWRSGRDERQSDHDGWTMVMGGGAAQLSAEHPRVARGAMRSRVLCASASDVHMQSGDGDGCRGLDLTESCARDFDVFGWSAKRLGRALAAPNSSAQRHGRHHPRTASICCDAYDACDEGEKAAR